MVSRSVRATVFLAAVVGTQGFAPSIVPTPVSSRGTKTELFADAPLPPITNLNYGEESRLYRRTVYTHDDWVKHRSPQRFLRQLSALTASGVYKNIGNEVLATTLVATLICVFNNVAGGYVDMAGVKHDALIQASMIGLPLVPFTLASPSLGLLLGKFFVCHGGRSL
jgi:putative membrane protein